MNKICLIFNLLFLIESFAQIVTVDVPDSNDTYISNSNGNNNTLSNNIKIGKENSTTFYRSLLYFDIENNAPLIPSNAIIVSAKLFLKPISIENTSSTIYNVQIIESNNVINNINNLSNLNSLNWILNSSINFNSFNSDFSLLTLNNQATSNSIGGFREFELKSIIQEFVSKQRYNFGISIKANDETAILYPIGNYHSKESSNSSFKPKLTIKYYLPLSINSCVINHASTTTSSDGSISLSIQNLNNNLSNSIKWTNSSGTQIGTTLNLTGINSGIYNCEITFPTQPELNFYYSFLVGVKCQDINLDFISNA